MKKSHSVPLALVLFAGALAVLGVGFAEDVDSAAEEEEITYQTCTFETKTYGHHAILCMEGILYRCDGAGSSSLWRTMPEGKCAKTSEAKSCLYEGNYFGVGAVKKMEGTVYECTTEEIWVRQEGVTEEAPADS